MNDAHSPALCVRHIDVDPAHGAAELTREWLVTNALGGYASGTIEGVPTRRYHGVLVAVLPEHGRTVMLNHLGEEIRLPNGTCARLDAARDPHATIQLSSFRLEGGLPVWQYTCGDCLLEKRIHLVYGQNTAHVSYRLLSGHGPLTLRLFPALAFRPHDAPLEERPAHEYTLTTSAAGHYTFSTNGFPPLHLVTYATEQKFTLNWKTGAKRHYAMELSRGYGATQALLEPGSFKFVLADSMPGATLVASTEPWPAIEAHAPAAAAHAEHERRRRLVQRLDGATTLHDELVIAADAFVVTPSWRVHDMARGRASGLRFRSIIAGYHWFTDWGRDTMISLEGLTLVTGRQHEARDILVMFAEHVRDGLIPNLFPEGREEGLYHTADATLWFFHALDRYVTTTGDNETLHNLLPVLRTIVAAHLHGTRFGIGVDSSDGLLRQGAPGYQLTWMDAKVGDWVVTPRRGKAVEINALWYNALCLLEAWLRTIGEDARGADEIVMHAQRARQAFNTRFWNDASGYLYDVVDGEAGDDAACRPNQVFAISLRHPVLDRARWHAVMDVVTKKLLTPFGLRSLAPGHPDYKARYFGDLKARDAAYHQGTVWAWLIGPYIDAWLKLHPDDTAGARRMLDGLLAHLGEAGIGSISEVFDAEAPFTARGCIAQAWSVAEVLRCLLRTHGG